MKEEYENIEKICEISKLNLEQKEKEYIQNSLNEFKKELEILTNIDNINNMSFGYTENINEYSTSNIESERDSILNNSKFKNGNFIEFMESKNE